MSEPTKSAKRRRNKRRKETEVTLVVQNVSVAVGTPMVQERPPITLEVNPGGKNG